jgi:adenosylcobinamide-GDP ribazoletransferase
VRSLLAAIAFLTRIPLGKTMVFDAAGVTRAAAWFPVVGMLLGAIYVGVAAACQGHLSAFVIAVLLIALEAFLTGALHFDGLADSADGFGGGRTREDVLRIMRDHAIGSYGGTALATCVALKAAAYAALLSGPDWMPAIVLAPALGRWSILLLTATLPYARESKSVVEGMGKRSLVWGTATMLLGLAATRSLRGWIAMLVAVVVTAAFGFYCRRRIGGITGDTLGANVELCESAALIAFLWVPSQ